MITHQSKINRRKLRKQKTSVETNEKSISSISKTIGAYNTANWDTSYSWGNHATVGYLTTVDISDINATGTADATTFLRGDGTWSTPAGGGSPAGANSQIQFNNGGAFGASANLVWDNFNSYMGINVVPTVGTLEVQGKLFGSMYRAGYFNTATAGTGRSVPLQAVFSDTSTTLTSGLSGINVGNNDTTNNNYASFNFTSQDTSAVGQVFGNMAVQFTNHATGAIAADYVFNLRDGSGGVMAERMRLVGSTGNLGLGGVTSPEVKIDLDGRVRFRATSQAAATSGTGLEFSMNTSNNAFILPITRGTNTLHPLALLAEELTVETGTTAGSRVVALTVDVNQNIIMPVLPTSSAGLPTGALWNDSGTLKIV